jgi:glutamate--cysteine ligase
LDSYASSLQGALTKPYAPYEAIGIRNPGGDYNQLASSLLQIENEFYGTIRPKRVIAHGERPLRALRERGVEYVEVRCMDLDPFVPIGIQEQTLRFIDVFLLHCLLTDSPPDTPQEIAALGRNQLRVAARGREPGLMLERGDGEIALREWGLQLLGECAPAAAALDEAHGVGLYGDALADAREVLNDPERTPSAQVLSTMIEDFEGSYTAFTREQSLRTKARLLGLPFPVSMAAHFAALAEASVAEQKRIEAADTLPFEDYRQAYLSTARLGL